MNKDKLKSLVFKKASGNNHLSAQLYQMYFFEHILERLSKSKYKHHIILKGGLFLSSIIGEDMRTTKDMDVTLTSFPLERESVETIIREILSIYLDDHITYEIIDVKDIRHESEYGGFRISILAIMETLKIHLAIEFTTGDKITPREIEYNYHCIFEDKEIPILAYTLETVIASKYQTIIDRDIYNTRMKDFYDIYILIHEIREQIDFDNLILAIQNTFKNRGSELNISEIKEQLKHMKTSERFLQLWKNYQQIAPYSKNISFDDLFEALEYIADILSNEGISVQ